MLKPREGIELVIEPKQVIEATSSAGARSRSRMRRVEDAPGKLHRSMRSGAPWLR